MRRKRVSPDHHTPCKDVIGEGGDSACSRGRDCTHTNRGQVGFPRKPYWYSSPLSLNAQSHEAIGVAKRLHQAIPDSIILNQYSNEDNPLAHELTTGPEIIDAIVSDYSAHSYNPRKSSGKVDAVIIGAGTGGTITGVSKAIKKTHNPDCQIIGIDPVSVENYCESLLT